MLRRPAATWISFQNEAWLDSIHIDGEPLPPAGQFPQIHYDVISPDFFRTLGISLLKGRFFSEYDNTRTPRVAIVNSVMAQRCWPSADPLGKHMIEGSSPDTAHLLTVVGVVGNTEIDGLDKADEPQFYIPFFPTQSGYLTFTTAISPILLISYI